MFGDEINIALFIKGLIQIVNNNQDGKFEGALLIHDMENCFLHDGFSSFSSIVNAGTFLFQDEQMFDISKITFIGEVNTNSL